MWKMINQPQNLKTINRRFTGGQEINIAGSSYMLSASIKHKSWLPVTNILCLYGSSINQLIKLSTSSSVPFSQKSPLCTMISAWGSRSSWWWRLCVSEIWSSFTWLLSLYHLQLWCSLLWGSSHGDWGFATSLLSLYEWEWWLWLGWLARTKI